jgi:hypothetical protein
LHRKKKSNQKIIGGRKWGERENLKKYEHQRESNLKIPPTSSTKLVSTWCFCKIQQKLKTTSERHTQLELLGVWRIHQNLNKQNYREMHNLTYLGFVKIQQRLRTTSERDSQLELLGVCKIHQNLKTTSERDAQLELLVFSKIQQKAQNVFTERCITWTSGCSSKSNKKLNHHHHQRDMHNLNYTWCFWKSNKKLRKTPERDAPLELLGIFLNPTKVFKTTPLTEMHNLISSLNL